MFSALYSMLPESKGYLIDDGWTDQRAGLVMMGCFVAGFFGIQAVSRLLHLFMPSHVVDCDHSHDEPNHDDQRSWRSSSHDRHQSRSGRSRRRFSRRRSSQPASLKQANGVENGHGQINESTPLLDTEMNGPPRLSKRHASERGEMTQYPGAPLALTRSRTATAAVAQANRRPSMFQVPKRVMSFVKDTKSNCDEMGFCYGFTDPCGQECFKHLGGRPSTTGTTRGPTMLRTTTGPLYPQSGSVFHGGEEQQRGHSAEPLSPRFRTSRAASREPAEPCVAELPELAENEEENDAHDAHSHHDHELNHSHSHEHDHAHSLDHNHGHCHDGADEDDEDVEAQHHHHVPTNAFLSIGLQTSIAIALHKFPEGFITYATNHANPQLGFNVFMALFVHNISEGFAMCLPLYMALGSRWRAMAWSALLGGLSQPLGAGIAALWFHLASRTHVSPSPVAYACLFAGTSGIMVSVALQLFVESLSLNHDRNLCIFFGFLGMVVLGLSNAMFAH